MGFPCDPSFYESAPVPRTIPTTSVSAPRDQLQAVCERLAHAADIDTEAQQINAEQDQEQN
ncbi:hypothetical protein [Corynebacterium variabile]|uniref:hypothetical protein n=1 Tax=Corynebacterium variabile TaxID=1727 RepID=UPI0028AE97E5|nr:hypothetical protein [Corynebacterium variabile]